VDQNDLLLTPLQRLCLAYAPRKSRSRYTLLFAFDDRMASICEAVSEPMLGQIRFAWWREALAKLAGDGPRGEPLLTAITELEDAEGLADQLATLVDAWEDYFTHSEVRPFTDFAAERGRIFWQSAMGKEGLSDAEQKWSAYWAGWDWLRQRSVDDETSQDWRAVKELVCDVDMPRLPRTDRPLAILARLARRDLNSEAPTTQLYSPGTALRIICYGLGVR